MSLFYLILIWNLVVFMMYAMDKLAAKRTWRRVPERVLITSAVICGGVGAYISMMLFRHKTRHMKFRIILPLAALLTAGVASILLFWLISGSLPFIDMLPRR